jgi:ABC-type nitrate/sulfonate/bicarbonate transport system substrate-binding protein
MLRYQGSTGNVTFPELAEDLGYLGGLRLEYVGNTISGPQDIQTVVTRDTDFGAAFNGAIVNLIAAGAPIRSVIGMSSIDERTWNGFYVLESSPIRSARDFIGKQVAMNTLGAHSQFMLEEYLYRNGLTRADVQQVTLVVVPPVNAELALRQRQVEVAVLGNIEWSRETPEPEVVARLRRIIANRNRNENDGAIGYWKSTRAATRGGVIEERELQTWIDWLERDGQLAAGRIPARALYTNEFNPFARGAEAPVLRGAPAPEP